MIQKFPNDADLMQSLLWKHNAASALTSLVQSKQEFFHRSQSSFWSDWYRDVFNLKTANAFGLQVWARILNVRLSVPVDPNADPAKAFGFGNANENFENGNFARTSSGSEQLTIDEQRIILRLRYYKLIGNCTIPDINRSLSDIFSSFGSVYVIDPMDMSAISYVFSFNPGQRLLDLLRRFAHEGVGGPPPDPDDGS